MPTDSVKKLSKLAADTHVPFNTIIVAIYEDLLVKGSAG